MVAKGPVEKAIMSTSGETAAIVTGALGVGEGFMSSVMPTTLAGKPR